MWIRYGLLGFFGLCAGGFIAAGFFAFITAIGIITTFAQRSHTSAWIRRYEDIIIVGAVAGNLIWTLEPRLTTGIYILNLVILVMSGLLYGVFIGSLVIGLAETIQAIPIFFKRMKVTHGLAIVIIAFAAGKCIGSLIYAFCHLAAGG